MNAKFQCLSFVLKRLCICHYSIYMTVPLKYTTLCFSDVTAITFENYDNMTNRRFKMSFDNIHDELKGRKIKLRQGLILFFRKYQVGCLATRSQMRNKNKKERRYFYRDL